MLFFISPLGGIRGRSKINQYAVVVTSNSQKFQNLHLLSLNCNLQLVEHALHLIRNVE